MRLFRSCLFVALACRAPAEGQAPANPPPVATATPTKPTAPAPPNGPELPIAAAAGGRFAADDATWTAADSFRRTPREYGEPSWDHVRGRVVAHLAITGRDLARRSGARGDWEACAATYTAAAADTRGVPLADAEVAEFRDLLAADLDRDAALCAALAAGKAPPEVGGGLAMWRARTLALGQRAAGGEDVRSEASRFAAALKAQASEGFSPPPPAASAGPAEKTMWLARAWGDTVDPLVMTDPWGPWTLAEPRRQAAGLVATLDAMAGGETKSLHMRPAASLRQEATDWTGAEFSRPALRDAWGDVGGFAMPHLLPQLEIDAAAWSATNQTLAARWSTMREGEVPRAVRGAVARLEGHAEGIRWFEAQALQNAAIRQLARQGHFLEALDVLREQSPARGIDWFCPDRAGVLLGLEGRLRLVSGDQQAERKLREARSESHAFLTFIAMCQEIDAAAAP
jgi:hypothetical protein